MRALFAILLALMPALAGGIAQAEGAGDDVLSPAIPKAVGPAHPEGNDFMRMNHMKFLKHDRDLTMHLGDRNIEFSIKQCVTCHAVKGEDGQPVSFESPKHFCRVCHDFAAVKPDCFECHNSKPDAASVELLLRKYPDDKELAAFLEGIVK